MLKFIIIPTITVLSQLCPLPGDRKPAPQSPVETSVVRGPAPQAPGNVTPTLPIILDAPQACES